MTGVLNSFMLTWHNLKLLRENNFNYDNASIRFGYRKSYITFPQLLIDEEAAISRLVVLGATRKPTEQSIGVN